MLATALNLALQGIPRARCVQRTEQTARKAGLGNAAEAACRWTRRVFAFPIRKRISALWFLACGALD